MRILSREEQEQLRFAICAVSVANELRHLPDPFYRTLIGELCALTWEDIHLREKRSVHSEQCSVFKKIKDQRNHGRVGKQDQNHHHPPKSSKSIRHIPIPESVAEILGEYQRYGMAFLTGKEKQRYIEPRTRGIISKDFGKIMN